MSWSIRKFLNGSFGRKIHWSAPSINSNRGTLSLHWSAKYTVRQKHVFADRSFHIDSTCFVKRYVETENEHANSYLQKISLYSRTLSKPMDLRKDVKGDNLNDILSQDWSCRAVNEVFDAFRSASVLSKQHSLDVCSPMLESLCSAVVDNSDKYEESQLLGLLQCLSLWPPPETIKSAQYYSLWKTLDEVCLKRMTTWDVDTSLLVVDHWARLNLARSSKFVQMSLKRICRKLQRLSPQQFVQLMFYISSLRQLPLSASKYEFQYKLETLINKLTLEELSIVSMGFFKSQTHIRSQQISEEILSRLKSSFRNGEPSPPDSIMLAALLKLLRNCAHPTQDVKLHDMLDAMLPHLKNYSLLCCLHVALTGSNIQLLHEEVLHYICERFAAEMENCRLKDIERFAFILTLFNYDPKTNPCVYNGMVSEIRKRVEENERDSTKWKEIDKHRECLLRFLSYLTARQIFPLDLIEKAMDRDSIKKTYGNTWGNVGREVLLLDTSMEIHFPEKTKCRLTPEIRKMLTKKYQRDLSSFDEGKKLYAADRFHVNVLEHIRSISGSADKVALRNILPQFERPDIVFCIGKDQIFQDLSSHKGSHGVLQNCPADFGNWYAVITGGQNNMIKLSNQLIGPLVYKMSLLEKLGYKPILVPWFEWKTKRNDQKENYLREKIFNSVSHDSEVRVGTHVKSML